MSRADYYLRKRTSRLGALPRSRSDLKNLLSVLLVLTFSGLAHAQTIYERTFTDSTQPGWRRSASGPSASEFNGLWSLTRSLQTETENQFAHFDLSIPSLPPSDGTRWYGGYFDNIGSFTSLPAEWQLSFEVRFDVVELFRVQIHIVPSFVPSQFVTLTAWVAPSTLGWNTVTLDQNSFATETGRPIGGVHNDGTYLSIAMASHDPDANPLSLANTGSYSFSLDNISMTAVPEPHTVGLLLAALSLAFCLSRRARLTRPAPDSAE